MRRCGTAVRPLVFETYGRLGGEGTKLLRDLVATAAANGQCSPHAVGRWRTQLERVLLTAQADTHLRALGSRVAERLAAEPPLLSRACTVLFGGACIATRAENVADQRSGGVDTTLTDQGDGQEGQRERHEIAEGGRVWQQQTGTA